MGCASESPPALSIIAVVIELLMPLCLLPLQHVQRRIHRCRPLLSCTMMDAQTTSAGVPKRAMLDTPLISTTFLGTILGA